MRIVELAVTVTSISDFWCDVTVHFDERDFFTRIRRDAVNHLGLPLNERAKVYGYIEKGISRYGTATYELKALRQEEAVKMTVDKYLPLFRQDASERGFYYKNAVDEIHRVGCHDYDSEFEQTERDLEKANLIRYFRYSYDDGRGYIYEDAVDGLHKLGCHDYDSEIEQARSGIMERKEALRREAHAGEKHTSAVKMDIPARQGCRKPAFGVYLLFGGRLYFVMSCRYHGTGGRDKGFAEDGWYEVSAKDVSGTGKAEQVLSEGSYQEYDKAVPEGTDREVCDVSTA